MSKRDITELNSVYADGENKVRKDLDAIGEKIENNLAAWFDQDKKKELFRDRFNNIYKEVLCIGLDSNDGLLEGLCNEIVMVEEALLKAKNSENSCKCNIDKCEQVLIHYSDIAYDIAKNKYFGTRNTLLGKYLKPLYSSFLESIAENVKTKAAHTIAETFNELNYSSGLSRRISIRLGIASSGYHVCI